MKPTGPARSGRPDDRLREIRGRLTSFKADPGFHSVPSGLRRKKRRKEKRKRNAVRRCSVTTAALRAAALPHPHGKGSTPSGVPRRFSQSDCHRLAQLRARLHGTQHRTRRASLRRRRPRLQRAPRTPVIVPAGMMSEPPGNGSDEPPSAGTALAPPAAVTRPASFT